MPHTVEVRDQKTPPFFGQLANFLKRFLAHPHLSVWIVALGVGLSSPSLFIGFHLDDIIGRFIFSDLPGAERLFEIYAGGYGTANGDPADAQWMIEEGFAPWWMDPELLVYFYRPVGLVTHLLDAELWPNSAFMWHAHSLLWLGVLLWAATVTYRGLLGPIVGGLAALLYAVDHTHGVAIGFSTNRYVLIATAFSLLALHQHHRFRSGGPRSAAVLSPLWYGLALFSGESSVTIAGYLFGYALFVDRGSWLARGASLLPCFFVTIGWRLFYNALGHGARGSDLYIDPIREPATFLAAVFVRGPLLLLGQWFVPPAETYGFLEGAEAVSLLAFAWLFAGGLALALVPLLRRDRLTRFWLTGMLLALVPMCAGEPHNRMLFTSGIGAMGILAQWWNLYASDLPRTLSSWRERVSRGWAYVMMVFHLLLSAAVLPVIVVSLVFMSALNASFADVGARAVGRDAIFVTVPDYFAVRLMRMHKEVEGEPTPRRFLGLTYGPEPVTVYRTGARTLEVDIEGGAMHMPAITKPALDLYRSRNKPMVEGQQVSVEGLGITVLEVTKDGRPMRARFEFEMPLESDNYRFYYWADNTFQELRLPAAGAHRTLPSAIIEPNYGF